LKKILGYKLKNVPIETIDLPKRATIVTALDVNGEPTLFALINVEEKETDERVIHRIETGKSQLDSIAQFVYIGSFAIANYGIVYHFYEDPFRKSNLLEAKIDADLDYPKGSISMLSQITHVPPAGSPPEYPFQR
jgi:hypothetical protein